MAGPNRLVLYLMLAQPCQVQWLRYGPNPRWKIVPYVQCELRVLKTCVAIVVDRKLNVDFVQRCLAGLFAIHGPPDYIRSDHEPLFTVDAVREWLARIKMKTFYTESRPP